MTSIDLGEVEPIRVVGVKDLRGLRLDLKVEMTADVSLDASLASSSVVTSGDISISSSADSEIHEHPRFQRESRSTIDMSFWGGMRIDTPDGRRCPIHRGLWKASIVDAMMRRLVATT